MDARGFKNEMGHVDSSSWLFFPVVFRITVFSPDEAGSKSGLVSSCVWGAKGGVDAWVCSGR